MEGVEPIERLPGWVRLLRAPNPGPMTLDGTNTWVLRALGSADAVVIDPGPDDAGHLAAVAEHQPVSAILLTHGHHDHAEGAAKLSALLGEVPVRAADPAYCVGSEPLTPGTLHLAGLDIEVLGTPGHTRDSLSFVVHEAVFSGDTILGKGTTVVAWPDGDLMAYLNSLTTLATYEKVLLPGHGPALSDCGAIARAYLAHRRDRLEQVRRAVAGGADTAEAVLDAVYPDIDPAIRFAAEASTQAQLDYLRRESHGHPERLDPL